jgi:hypothetical protein
MYKKSQKSTHPIVEPQGVGRGGAPTQFLGVCPLIRLKNFILLVLAVHLIGIEHIYIHNAAPESRKYVRETLDISANLEHNLQYTFTRTVLWFAYVPQIMILKKP